MKPYYEHNGIQIFFGDCSEVMGTLTRQDALVTDPPYGIGEAAGKNKSRGKLAVAKDFGNFDWDNAPASYHLICKLREFTRWQIIFGGNYYPLPASRCWLVWDKQNGDSDFADCELAWTNMDKAVRRISWRWAGMLQENMADKEFRVHPTQKPEAVMKWAINQLPDSVNSILDPFMGSGTTLVAAKSLGKSAIGIEREERYCEAAAKRLSQEVFTFDEERVSIPTQESLSLSQDSEFTAP